MSSLNNFSKLIRNNIHHNKLPLKDLKSIIRNYTVYDLSQFYLYPKKNEYVRVKLPVTNHDDNYEIMLLNWGPYSKTKIHNHPKNGCILKIINGNLEETKYDYYYKQINKPNKLIKNDISYIDDTIGYHTIFNNSNNITHSLHVYSPPNFYN